MATIAPSTRVVPTVAWFFGEFMKGELPPPPPPHIGKRSISRSTNILRYGHDSYDMTLCILLWGP